MQLSSSDFTTGGAIPIRFTCEGDTVSPELSWKEAPQEAKPFALIMHDPDAPRAGGFTHWVLHNIPGEKVDSNLRSRNESRLGVQACRVETDGGEIGYIGRAHHRETIAITCGSSPSIRN